MSQRDFEERHRVEWILETAGRILSERLGGQVRLRERTLFPGGPARKSIVVRCEVIDAPADAPETVIVKKLREDRAGFPYAPDSADVPNAAHGFLDEWAVLEFLAGIPGDPPLAPHCYSGDRGCGVLLIEDLGDGEGPSTDELLHGNDPARAEEGLIEYITAIGRLHAATIGGAEEYGRIRRTLGPPPTRLPLYHDPWSNARRRASHPDEVREAIRQYSAVFQVIGIRPHAGTDQEIEEVTHVVEEEPGLFLALCQGDQNGVGGLVRCGAGLRFFDFDCGGFRHALLEGMPSRITWGGMVRSPARLVRRMEGVYRAELAKGCPAAADDAVFRRAMVEAGAHWHILHSVHRLPEALERDRPRGPSTVRQQCLAWIDAFAELAEEFRHMPALGRSARDLAARLRTLWPPETHRVPFYSVFGDG